ncbi:NADP-dependent oxidoreductase [Primorskyibacter sp. S187A]|uniref:NADP-dependent oxidoreductase n=1 Tax=Primorskyibacter sp. S187A TaxID=3415130 RepID=UPI003C7A9B2E
MKQVVLAQRPNGPAKLDNFRVEEGAMPEPGAGEVLIEVSHLSLDPYMRGRMDDVKSYAPSVALGEKMTGQGVGHVLASRADGIKEGDLVTGITGWASHAVLPGEGVRKLDTRLPATTALGVLGMPGFTAWAAMKTIGAPQSGETLAVAAATGPVGSMVGQIAKRAGLRTIAIAGGEEKCTLAKDTFGFDAALDHRAHDVKTLRAALSEAAQDGIDIYFENVGGKVLQAALPLMNTHGRIPLIGTIAWYSGVDTSGPDHLPALWRATLVKRLRIQGLIVFDHWDLFPEFLEEMTGPVAQGDIAYIEDITEGLENAPSAFLSLLNGGNTGKAIVAI